MATERPSISKDSFIGQMSDAGIDGSVADFVWEQMQPYYFAPLTPYPNDRPIGDMRVDPEDLSDIVLEFEGQFGRQWIGEWVGPEDPTLNELAFGLLASTKAK